MIRAPRGRHRRAVTALPAAALALALSCAGALATPASAADGPATLPDPGVARQQTAGPKPTASDAELRERAAEAAKAEEAKEEAAKEEAAKAGEKPSDSASSSASPDSTDSADSPESSEQQSPFIIGGTETTISSAPWMVQLYYYDDVADESYFCGGTLVAPNKVLTAAHCVAGLDWQQFGSVVSGTTDLLDGSTGTVAGVWRQWSHPKYDESTIKNDVAVITLDRPLEQAWLRLAASNDSSLYTPGTAGTVYGWGLTSGGADAELSPKLRKASLKVVADSTCNTAMQNVLGEDLFAEGSMICAGTPATGGDAGTISPCNGDSGGPLVVNGKIIGIVSWGVQGCTGEGAYPVFTKVSSYTWAAQPRIDDTDLSYDGRADLLARTPSGNLFQQDSKGTSLATRAYQGNGWEYASWAMQADLDRDFYQDLIIRDKTDGKLYRSYLDHSTWEWTWMQISSVWGGYKSYAIPGDLTGDARPDLVALDADGSVYLYPGKGNGQFNSKIKVVSGAWKGMKLMGRGDLSGDGKADLLVRYPDGTLYLYRGTGKASAPWSSRIKARTGWNFTSYVTNGDVNGDGIADVMARDSGGTLWLYRGTGKASSDLFSSRISLGTGFNQYNMLF
ncbi:trypsin-like serine protease [Streptomyces acidicola]|uniref:Trypsin-like serine protease n=1 Tax=Streptomyces acidicola TaxID=2596892 RepID=A0A5N8X3C2_9ACTN|nr:trypsin-like serine protease [Streptomyces acidicola]MPY52955.1 trypsin-like serine protease [Streptomyces acidicola]